MSETGQAIERVRQDAPPWNAEDVRVLVREHDRLKGELALMPCGHPEALCQDVGPAYCEMCSQINDNTALLAELARLTTLQDASTHDGKTSVLIWHNRIPYFCGSNVMIDEQWTPLPNPREKEADREPQE